MTRRSRPRASTVAATALALTLGLNAVPASAATAAAATVTPVTGEVPADAPYWRQAIADPTRPDVTLRELNAYSPSMDRDVPLAVISPAGAPAPRPTIYLLNGADGGEGEANWIRQSDVIDFYADKEVNVVIPMSGAFSYYTDWQQPAPSLGGTQKWETFLTRELPGPLESLLGADGRRAIAGMSMSGTSSLLLAQHNPGLYDAAASYSGCASTTMPLPKRYLDITLRRGGTTPEMMWGPVDGPVFRHHDALLNAERLRGTEIYLSNGSGLAGKWDLATSPYLEGLGPQEVSNAMTTAIIAGGAIEAATNTCTHDMKAKLDSLGIPADADFTPTGTHTWGYWQDALRNSWPTFARAFGRAP